MFKMTILGFMYTTVPNVVFRICVFFIESTQQDCIDLIKNTVKHQYCEGITDLISCFVFEYVSKMYFILVIAKLIFQHLFFSLHCHKILQKSF